MTSTDKAALYGSIGVFIYVGINYSIGREVSYQAQDVIFGIFMTWFLSHYYD